jgi:hypothetical protein
MSCGTNKTMMIAVIVLVLILPPDRRSKYMIRPWTGTHKKEQAGGKTRLPVDRLKILLVILLN